MVTAELGGCEWFVYELRRSNLIDRGQLEQVVADFLRRAPRAEPHLLAKYLVEQKLLTKFQSERVLANKAQGLVLGTYILVDVLGSGSMGTVYRAASKTDGTHYAVKVLPRRSMWNVRLARRQVRAFGQFSHNSVVPFVDVGTSGGMHYLVWPLVEGEPLESMIQRLGKLQPDKVARIGYQIAQGLAIAHQNGLFHGLVKPSNLMIGPDGHARILDFGIGSLLAENEGESLVDTMSTANTLTSGLDCASPESIMEPTNRTPAGDQYSLGCTLYFCLTGRYPFPEGSAVEKMMAHQFKDPTPLKQLVPQAPDKLVALVERLMQKAPEKRFQDLEEVVAELLAIQGGLPHTAEPEVKSRVLLKPMEAKNPKRPSSLFLAPQAASKSRPASSYVLESAPECVPTPHHESKMCAAETVECSVASTEQFQALPSKKHLKPNEENSYVQPPGFFDEVPESTPIHPLLFASIGICVMFVSYLVLMKYYTF